MSLDPEKKEFGKWWLWVLLLVVISGVALAITSYAGKVTGTVVERTVFEQSYQKQAGDSKRIRTWRAQLAQINSRLAGELEPHTRSELESQAAMLRIQLQGN